ncbi:MAG: GNAT family N-acetyltransferase [Thaumarchaeota archaeon]|nr:GNAT family N-acetyltransferase [Nitrososphaerota archaeon]
MKESLEISVRKATEKDLPSILRNIRRVAREEIYIATEKVNDATKKYYLERMSDASSLTLVAVFQDRIIGALNLWPYWNLKKTRHVSNLGMHVIDEYRNKGVGSALMRHTLDWAAERQSIEKISLGVFSTNQVALNLYMKFGFVVEGILRKQHLIRGKYVDEIEMALFLKKERANLKTDRT